jgi:hypothetical protein
MRTVTSAHGLGSSRSLGSSRCHLGGDQTASAGPSERRPIWGRHLLCFFRDAFQVVAFAFSSKCIATTLGNLLKEGINTLLHIGGPAGSGVNQVLQRGKSIQAIVDNDDDGDNTGKYYDIISFDPRGIGNTHPSLECFPDVVAEQAWSVSGAGSEAIYGTENDAFPTLWSEREALSEASSVPSWGRAAWHTICESW